MSLTNDQLLDRIVAIEERLAVIETAMNNLATRKELKNTIAVIQQNAADLDSETETRLDDMDTAIEDIQTAMNNLVARKLLNQVAALRQQEIDALKDRVSALESQVSILQAGA